MKKVISLLALVVLVLTGCGQVADQGSEVETSIDSDFPITISHAFGETTIEEKPERISTIQWGNQDVVLALGVVPVGFSAANYGVQDDSGLLPWTKEKLDELGETDPNVYDDIDGLDFEAIADSDPDVILAPYSGITEEDYNTLSQIAPTIAYPESPWTIEWREQVRIIAEAIGMKQEGEDLIAETDEKVAEVASQYPQIEGKNVAWINFSDEDTSKFHMYVPGDPRVEFLTEIGFNYPTEINDLIEDPNSYSLSLSSEQIDVLNNVDVIVGYGDESLVDVIENDPVLGTIPAVQNGAYVAIGNGTPLAAAGNPNPLSIMYTLDDYMALLGDAADAADNAQ